jgi:hypothetical protein
MALVAERQSTTADRATPDTLHSTLQLRESLEYLNATGGFRLAVCTSLLYL